MAIVKLNLTVTLSDCYMYTIVEEGALHVGLGIFKYIHSDIEEKALG